MMECYVTTEEVARRLGVTIDTVRRWVRQGKLPGLLLGRAGYRIREADYEAFVHQKTAARREGDASVPSFTGPSFLPFLEAITDSEEVLARLSAIVDSSQDAIISKTLEGIITSWNAGAARLYGYKANEVLGCPITIIIPQEHRAEYAHIMEILRRGERIASLDTMHQRKDGAPISVSLTLSPLHNAQGELIGATIITRDIRERVCMEQALRASEERFRATFEQAAVGIAHVAPDGRWLAVNQRLCDLVGYSREELLSRTFQDITFPEDLETDLAYVRQLLLGERHTYTMEKRYIRRDGTLLWILLTVSLVRDECGVPQYFISVIEDINERKRLERLRDEFLAMVGHELRTPITSLKGFSVLLQRRLARLSDEPSLAYLVRVQAQYERLARLIEDLLDLSRLQLGQLPLEQNELIDLAQLVREVAELVQATTSQRLQLEEVTSGAQAEENAPMLIQGDRDRLAQVFSNLLVNAIKYSPQADRVLIRLDTHAGEAIVQVQDFGIGIAPAYHEQIFERFYKAPDPVAKTFPGMGIGLYLAREILTRHQGSIEVESEPNAGTTFTVRLPLAHTPQQGEERLSTGRERL